MAKNDWDDIVKEKVSEELRHKTLARVRQEMDQKKNSNAFSWNWLLALVPGLAALVFFFNQQKEGSEEDDLPSLAVDDPQEDYLKELASLSDEEIDQYDEEMIEKLDFYKDLDVLEEWDGREES